VLAIHKPNRFALVERLAEYKGSVFDLETEKH
jgi:hypothetical protein